MVINIIIIFNRPEQNIMNLFKIKGDFSFKKNLML